jgi:hypothetical protein
VAGKVEISKKKKWNALPVVLLSGVWRGGECCGVLRASSLVVNLHGRQPKPSRAYRGRLEGGGVLLPLGGGVRR